MALRVLLCTDGSDLAEQAISAGVALLPADAQLIVATSAEDPDPTLVTGAGMAGGVMTGEEFDRAVVELQQGAEAVLAQASDRLPLPPGTGSVLLRGDPGPAICAYAAEEGLDAIVIGSHGRSGLRRAVLGSVSDYVVRNAPCPVVVTSAGAASPT